MPTIDRDSSLRPPEAWPTPRLSSLAVMFFSMLAAGMPLSKTRVWTAGLRKTGRISMAIDDAARPPSTTSASIITVTAIGFLSEARIKPFMVERSVREKRIQGGRGSKRRG